MVAHFELNKVAEYDTTTLKELWAWAAVKLRNGNLLNVHPGQYVQGLQRLCNSNTFINNHKGNPSILEVSPENKVVWSVPTSLIPNYTTVQIIGEEGIAEKPGNLLR